MPTASSTSLATLRPEIAGSFEEFNLAMDRQGFISHRVLPVFDVLKQTGIFGKIPIEQLLESPDTARTTSGGYNRGNWEFEDDTFATKEHGWEEPVDEREAALYRDFFDAEVVAANRALDIVLRSAEQRVATAVFNATTWTGASLTTAVTNEWDDLANATPITDVKDAKQAVFDSCGMWPNAMILNRTVMNNLRECTQIIDRLKYSGVDDPKNVNAQMLAALFDVDELIVAGSPKNTANKGQAASLSMIWSNEYCMLAKIAQTDDIKEPCIGRTFHWSEDGSTVGGTVESYRDEAKRSDIIRVRHDVHEKIIYPQAAHLLSNITT